jgi:hypothetical protein
MPVANSCNSRGFKNYREGLDYPELTHTPNSVHAFLAALCMGLLPECPAHCVSLICRSWCKICTFTPWIGWKKWCRSSQKWATTLLGPGTSGAPSRTGDMGGLRWRNRRSSDPMKGVLTGSSMVDLLVGGPYIKQPRGRVHCLVFGLYQGPVKPPTVKPCRFKSKTCGEY